MPTSSINTEWNRYEVALLIDYYQSFLHGKMSRKDAVSALSKRLRDRMIKLGMSISDTYRNENGIDLQMHAIENALSNGEEGPIKASRLFCEIADLYINNNAVYESILMLANAMFPPVVPVATLPQQPKKEHVSTPAPTTTMVAESPKYVNSKIKKILEKKFPNGYRLSSTIETKRLLRYFQEEYGYELNMEMDDIDEDVKACGIVYETRVYLPELMLSNEAKMQLINFIKKSFDDGQTSVYYSVLFNKFHDAFLDSNIYDERMLHEYLESINTYGWHFKPQYLSKKPTTNDDIPKEVEKFVKSQGNVVSEDQVVEALSYLPANLVRQAFNNKIPELISSGRGFKFHIDNFALSKDEIKQIHDMIAHAVQKYNYITFSELLQDIRNQQPQIIDNNEVFGDLGLRKVLAKQLGTKFSFTNNIISDIGNTYSAYDCFVQLAQRDEYTIQDVAKLANDCGTVPNAYIVTLLDYSCRINDNQFISNKRINFDVDAIDAVLLRFCGKDYSSLYDVSPLSILPSCGYPWTTFLLESYVFKHSKLFKLVINDRLAQQSPVGAIVKRNSNIKTFNDLVIIALADANIELNEETALEFLYNKGYIAMRRYDEIKKAIKAASLQRNNKTK